MAFDSNHTLTQEEARIREPGLAHYSHQVHQQQAPRVRLAPTFPSLEIKSEPEPSPQLGGNWYENGTTYRIRQMGNIISMTALGRLGTIQFQGKGDLRDGVLQANLWFTDGTWGFCSLMLMNEDMHLAGTLVNGISGAVQSIRLQRD